MSYTFTTNLGLVAVREETPSVQDWAATYWNWINADKIMYSLLTHVHTGAAALANPDAAPVMTTADTGGTLPAGTTYYGVISFFDSAGRETGKSASASVTTAAGISAPNTPLHNYQATPTDLVATASALVGGYYWYKLTYIKDGGESLPSSPVAVVIPSDQTYSATIHFDSLDTAANGATAIYVYRKTGTTGSYVKLAEITSTSRDYYTDDNTGVPTCDKQPPTVSTINAFNTVTFDWSGVSYASAAYVNLYVTTTASSGTPTFTSSAHRVVSIAVDLATPVETYEWTGTALSTGKPLVTSQAFVNPPKITLDSEVQGNLPWVNLPSDFTWRQPVANEAALPVSSNNNGDVRLVEDSNTLFTWDGDLATPAWVEVSGGGVTHIQLPADLNYNIRTEFNSKILPLLPADPDNGDIVSITSVDPLFDIYEKAAYLYMWRGDWATPAWQQIAPILPTLSYEDTNVGGYGYSNFSAPPGTIWTEELSNGDYEIKVMGNTPYTYAVSFQRLTTRNLAAVPVPFYDWNGNPAEAMSYGWAYNESNGDILYEGMMQYMYDQWAFYVWIDSTEATPPPEGGEWVKRPQDQFRGVYDIAASLPATADVDDIAYCKTGADKGWYVYDGASPTWIKQ